MTEHKVGKILVVDDEVELRNALVEALISQSYEVVGFTDGRDALKALREQEFDVLLSDLMMPEMDGISVVKAALEIDPHLICIIMTGQGTIQTAVDAMKAGTFDYVLKPFRLQSVMPVLTRALNTRRLRLENLQLRETVAIYELSQTITFTLDPQTIISKLADAALQQTDADEVSILLPTENGDQLYVAAVRGENRQRLIGELVPLEESISGWVAREREPLILDGEVNDERFHALWPHPEIHSSISIPMQIANRLIGTIHINAINRPRPFTLGQMKGLTILASTAAAALESASLFAQVQRAEEDYRSIFDNAVEGIFRYGRDRRFMTVNPSVARILGYDSPEEVIDSITDVGRQLYVRPELAAQVTRTLKEKGMVRGFEFEAYRKNGEKIWLSLNVRLLRDQNGAMYREGSIEDVTERKRAEAALRESEERYRDLVESLPVIIYYVQADPPYSPLFLNSNIEALGYSTDEWYSKPDLWVSMLHPDDREWVLHETEVAKIAGGETEYEYRVVAKDGSIRWLHDRGRFFTDPSGARTWQGVILDITERKRAEEALRESEERYRDLVENAHDIIYSHDLQGNYTSANRAAEEITGYTREESLKLNLATTIAPECLERAREMLRRKLKGEKVTAYELEVVAKDGHRIPVEVNTRLVFEDGVPVAVTGVARDITQRKQAEAELRFQKSLLESQSEASIDGVLVVSPNREILSFNRRFLELWDLTAEELAAKSDEAALRGVIDRVASADEFIARVQYLYQHPDERSFEEIALKDGRTLERHSAPVHGPAGEYYGRVWFFRDITDRKLAQAELIQLAAAVEQTAESIIITDLEGCIEYVNPAFERITGYAKEEVLGQNPRFLKSGKTDPATYTQLWQTLTKGGVWTGQLINLKKDGTVFSERGTISAVRDQSGAIAHYLAVKQDTTRETELEDQLRQSQKMEAIGRLAGGVAHDFNNLLTAINGYSSLALKRLDDNNSIKPYLEEVKKAGEHAANLTRQLLAFGRKQILQPLALDLNSVVSDMNKMLRRLIGEDIELTAKLALDLKKIRADPGQIEQVLVNLVVNARDAMPQGGKLTIETANVKLDQEYAVRHVGVHPANYVMLAVSDTGTGMNEETRARIFEPFFTTKEKGKGTGLGLSTVYGIVQQSGGSIWVYSEPGRGTSFKVYLPELQTEAKSQHSGEKQDEIPSGSETVLLVEDEETVRGLTQKILEEAGYKVLPATGGKEAFLLCRDAGPSIDLLLTDVVMPEFSGKEIADQLGQLLPGMKVLFMSGYTDEAIVHHGVLDSNVEFIQKPFTPMALSKKVREVLDSNGRKS